MPIGAAWRVTPPVAGHRDADLSFQQSDRPVLVVGRRVRDDHGMTLDAGKRREFPREARDHFGESGHKLNRQH